MQSVLDGYFGGVMVEKIIYLVPLGLALYSHTLHVANNVADSLTHIASLKTFKMQGPEILL